MKITVLDAATLGYDISLAPLNEIGEVTVYQTSSPNEIPERINEAEVVIINKVKLNEDNLDYAKNLRLICIAATGYDNIDVTYCKKHGIAVCNVVGYSTDSVAQVTVSMALFLATHLNEYTQCVTSGEYTKKGVPNCLTPVYRELKGMTWGIVGYGNIGRRVAKVAEALGCNVIINKRTPCDEYQNCDIDTLCKKSDIISLHVPLSDQTRGLIDAKRIAMMKKTAILINVARGAVTDEKALADAIKENRIGGIGIDVYSVEPFPKNHPFNEIKALPNVCLTPHMAWGAKDARERCLDEIILNVKAFTRGEKRNRVDM